MSGEAHGGTAGDRTATHGGAPKPTHLLCQAINVERVVAVQAAGVVQLPQRVVPRRRLCCHRLAARGAGGGQGLDGLSAAAQSRLPARYGGA